MVKYSNVRAEIDNGVDPLQVGVKKKYTKNRANTWVAWARRAFEALPDGLGTLDDVCAFLQADPDIAPLLDQRVYIITRTVPRWRYLMSNGMKRLPGLINTGEKRDGLTLYCYSPQDAVVDADCKRARKRAQPGLPYLGKKIKNAN